VLAGGAVAEPRARDEVGGTTFSKVCEVLVEGEQDERVLAGVVPAPGLAVREQAA
jgi:hypothetical protein